MVFLAENEKEALFFIEFIESRNLAVCVQEYIEALDEYTVGVLSSRDGRVISSIALKRNLSSKLSRAMSYGNRVISSGWSQGVIEEFPDICDHAEKIAKGLGSAWALNIQGRVKDGIFVPFEVNARHSGTSYMRALAGINEPVIALDSIFFSNVELSFKIRRGSYMRILTEKVSFY
jgi:carbamoyl-phosphate synthase large subunit